MRSKLLESSSRTPRSLDEATGIDAHATRLERTQMVDAGLEQTRSSSEIGASQVVEGYAYLQDALVQLANAPRLSQPDGFERFVALVELLTVELLDSGEESRRRSIVAVGATSSRKNLCRSCAPIGPPRPCASATAAERNVLP